MREKQVYCFVEKTSAISTELDGNFGMQFPYQYCFDQNCKTNSF